MRHVTGATGSILTRRERTEGMARRDARIGERAAGCGNRTCRRRDTRRRPGFPSRRHLPAPRQRRPSPPRGPRRAAIPRCRRHGLVARRPAWRRRHLALSRGPGRARVHRGHRQPDRAQVRGAGARQPGRRGAVPGARRPRAPEPGLFRLRAPGRRAGGAARPVGLALSRVFRVGRRRRGILQGDSGRLAPTRSAATDSSSAAASRTSRTSSGCSAATTRCRSQSGGRASSWPRACGTAEPSSR